MLRTKIICAIDKSDLNAAEKLVSSVKESIGVIKLGLEFFTAHGPDGVKKIKAQGLPIFLDMKFHDIPNTVAAAIANVTRLGVDMITVHTLGGLEMMKRAIDSANETATKAKLQAPLILGVTMLTSMNEEDMNQIGISGQVKNQVLRLAELAVKAGLKGLVCSPLELEMLRKELGKDVALVVPGIRPEGAEQGDQKRVMTPKEAIEKGADYLVIGRPISEAANPTQTAAEILESLHSLSFPRRRES